MKIPACPCRCWRRDSMCTRQWSFTPFTRYKIYVFKERQMLWQAMKVKRVEKCELLITSWKHGATDRICSFPKKRSFLSMWKCIARMTDGFARTQMMPSRLAQPNFRPDFMFLSQSLVKGRHASPLLWQMPERDEGGLAWRHKNCVKVVDDSGSYRETMTLPTGRGSCPYV